MFKQKRRFIAGAVCPRCGEMDKLVVFQYEGKDYRECVSCDFKDEMLFKNNSRELETRVNQSEEQKQSETSVVKLISPDN